MSDKDASGPVAHRKGPEMLSVYKKRDGWIIKQSFQQDCDAIGPFSSKEEAYRERDRLVGKK